MMSVFTTVDSPVGALLVTGDDAGITGLYLPSGAHPVRPQPQWHRDDAVFTEVARQLGEYFSGTRRAFELPLRPSGSAFQHLVWESLRAIPYAQTTSYGAIAAQLGQPGAARAVGLANARNPISIVVPCHRVVGADGSLTGYGGGLPAKRWLLAHELQHAESLFLAPFGSDPSAANR
jgi:methylated-DNA-[protein]-cysteine S-methyltransferase